MVTWGDSLYGGDSSAVASQLNGANSLSNYTKLSSLTEGGTSGSDIANLTGLDKPATINLGGDTASVSGGLQSTALSFIGTPDAITLGSGASTIQYALQPSSGIETIAPLCSCRHR